MDGSPNAILSVLVLKPRQANAERSRGVIRQTRLFDPGWDARRTQNEMVVRFGKRRISSANALVSRRVILPTSIVERIAANANVPAQSLQKRGVAKYA